MTTEEKFKAAVNVIRSLPKNGSFQPSNELMLRFYAYFKQATQGSCKGSRPGFWDIVGRAKYDAYKALGNMPKEEAMKRYVDELHGIVETMSYSDKVASFLQAPPNELDSLNMADLQLIVGDVIERVRSESSSPVITSREASPNRLHSSFCTTPSTSPTSPDDSDHTDDEYIDSVEVHEPRKLFPNGTIYSESITNCIVQTKDYKSRMKSKAEMHNGIDISQEIYHTVLNLKRDIETLATRVRVLECDYKILNLQVEKKRNSLQISPHLFVFIVIWPFVANFIMQRYLYKKHN